MPDLFAMVLRVGSPFMVAASLSAQPVMAQDIPTSALTSYANFRTALLRYGWSPDGSYGTKNVDGTSMYRYPEVICGNALCTAQWVARNGKKFNIVLWPDSAGDYRVAAQIEWLK